MSAGRVVAERALRRSSRSESRGRRCAHLSAGRARVVGVADDGTVDVFEVPRLLGVRPAQAYAVLLDLREPLSAPEIADYCGLGHRAVWEAVRRLWPAGLVSYRPPSGRDAGERFAPGMWELGNANPWQPSETHRRVLAALPASDQQVTLAKDLVGTLNLTRHSVNALLYELFAATLAAKDSVVQGTDRRKRYAAWRRTVDGDRLNGFLNWHRRGVGPDA